MKKGWVIIDEVQKIPKLLDLVHKSIETYKTKFILTGSSARKLKRGGANLLAGRAFLFIRNVEGFRSFLGVAAQMNGKALNFLKIGRECGIDSKTVSTYFQILEDTLVGFWVPGYHKSVRKAQKIQPKFYFFDLGVLRALEGTLESKPIPGTSMYGQYFESFVVNEIFRFNSYTQKDFRISHYQTSTGQEIDLILSKGTQDVLIEIKSTKQIDRVEVEKFARISSAFKKSKRYYISQDEVSTEIEGVHCLSWQKAIQEIFQIDIG